MATVTKNMAPIDERVKIPAAILAQSAAADALHQQAYTPVADQNTPPTEAAPPPDTQAPPPDTNTAPPVTPQVTPHVNQAPPADAPPVRSEKVENGSWEQKYWSLKARLDATTAQLGVERENTQALRGMLATLQSAPAPDEQNTPQNLVSDQERAEWGEDMLDVVARRAREAVAPELAQLRGELAQARAQLQGVNQSVAMSDREKMLGFLDSNLPDWRAINKKDEFIAWLGLQDELSGAKRHTMLMQAFEANNSPRVLAFFKSFLKEAPPPAGANEPGQQQANNSPASPSGKTPLENLAAPGRANTSVAPNGPTTTEKPTYTQAQIQKFYQDSARGVYRGREDERAAVERDIFAAQSEGRIKA